MIKNLEVGDVVKWIGRLPITATIDEHNRKFGIAEFHLPQHYKFIKEQAYKAPPK